MKAGALIGGGLLGLALYLVARKEQPAQVDAPRAVPVPVPAGKAPEPAQQEETPGVIGTWLDEIITKVEVMTGGTPRGIRNNNPGNIERTSTKWDGMAPEQTDTRFIQFVSPEYGIRAMARILNNYQRLYGLRTIEQIIGRWAPASENDTGAYVRHVANSLGIEPTTPIQVAERLPELVRLIIKHENGQQPYDDATIRRGVAMA